MGRAKSFRADNRGATAIEYAVVAPVFLGIVLGLVEFALYSFNRNYVKHVLYETARNINTGEIQGADDPEEAFKDAYCGHASTIVSCEQLYFDVRAFNRLEDVKFDAVEYDENGVPKNFKFEPGKSEQISVMRVALPYKFITPYMKSFLLGDEQAAIVVGYSIAKIEPFGCIKSCD